MATTDVSQRSSAHATQTFERCTAVAWYCKWVVQGTTVPPDLFRGTPSMYIRGQYWLANAYNYSYVYCQHVYDQVTSVFDAGICVGR